MSPETINLLETVFNLTYKAIFVPLAWALIVLVRQLMAIRKEQRALAQRTKALEDKVKCLPGDKDLHSLAMTVADLGGTVKALHATVESMKSVQDRQEDFLLRLGRGD